MLRKIKSEFKAESGNFTIESAIIVPTILVITIVFMCFMIDFAFETVKSCEKALKNESYTETVDEAETDALINSIFDFIEEVRE